MPALVAEGAKLRPGRSPDPVTAATKASLSSLAHRIEALDRELAELDERIELSSSPPCPICSISSASVPTPQPHS